MDKYINYVLKEIYLVPLDKKFKISDLFKKYEWDLIPVRERLILGTKIKYEILNNHPNFKIIDKTSSNQQQYIKLK